MFFHLTSTQIGFVPVCVYSRRHLHSEKGRLAQLVRAPALQAGCRGFESLTAHQNTSEITENSRELHTGIHLSGATVFYLFLPRGLVPTQLLTGLAVQRPVRSGFKSGCNVRLKAGLRHLSRILTVTVLFQVEDLYVLPDWRVKILARPPFVLFPSLRTMLSWNRSHGLP